MKKKKIRKAKKQRRNLNPTQFRTEEKNTSRDHGSGFVLKTIFK